MWDDASFLGEYLAKDVEDNLRWNPVDRLQHVMTGAEATLPALDALEEGFGGYASTLAGPTTISKADLWLAI